MVKKVLLLPLEEKKLKELIYIEENWIIKQKMKDESFLQMKGSKEMKNNNLIRTPLENITIGEKVKTAKGEPALRIKKPNQNKFETVPVSKLVELIVSNF